MTAIPRPIYNPPFNITRASHVTLTVTDLEVSERFYVEMVGLVPSSRSGDTLHLRGVEESCHHSLTLRRSDGPPRCERVGMRVQTEEDLDRAAAYFRGRGIRTGWAEVPHQGRTLRLDDPYGVPLEFCATMDVMPRMLFEHHLQKGGAALRLDHTQIHTADVEGQMPFYTDLGFRIAEYVVSAAPERITALFLERKGNPHDIVLMRSPGPRFHHVAYTCEDVGAIMRACDIAGNLGFGQAVERGPGRHGPGNAQFVYFRDPDGHRIELFTSHYQYIDIENEPVCWRPDGPERARNWSPPPPRSWLDEASEFPGQPVQRPV